MLTFFMMSAVNSMRLSSRYDPGGLPGGNIMVAGAAIDGRGGWASGSLGNHVRHPHRIGKLYPSPDETSSPASDARHAIVACPRTPRYRLWILSKILISLADRVIRHPCVKSHICKMSHLALWSLLPLNRYLDQHTQGLNGMYRQRDSHRTAAPSHP
jgi:hypothetical protein